MFFINIFFLALFCEKFSWFFFIVVIIFIFMNEICSFHVKWSGQWIFDGKFHQPIIFLLFFALLVVVFLFNFYLIIFPNVFRIFVKFSFLLYGNSISNTKWFFNNRFCCELLLLLLLWIVVVVVFPVIYIDFLLLESSL